MITIDQLANKMQSIVSDSESFAEVMFLGVKSVQSQMVERIFEDGKNSAGGKIGSYNTTDEIYVSDKSSPKAGTKKGKPNSEGKQKNNKTTYYDSYASFRAKQRQAAYVDLRLFGRLQSDFSNSPVIKGNSVVIAVSKENAGKARGNEDRFDSKIFSPTKDELKVLSKVITFEIKRKLFS